jgi:hypothetical protein
MTSFEKSDQISLTTALILTSLYFLMAQLYLNYKVVKSVVCCKKILAQPVLK